MDPAATNQPDIKQILAAWAGITVQRFQEEIDAKVYARAGLRITRRGVQSSRLGAHYSFGAARRRTSNLRNMWQETVQAGTNGLDRIQIAFMLYGRFVDMGVGKGVDSHLARYARNRRNGETVSRQPRRWYSKRKGYETHRLRELLASYYINIPLDLVENALDETNLSLTV